MLQIFYYSYYPHLVILYIISLFLFYFYVCLSSYYIIWYCYDWFYQYYFFILIIYLVSIVIVLHTYDSAVGYTYLMIIELVNYYLFCYLFLIMMVFVIVGAILRYDCVIVDILVTWDCFTMYDRLLYLELGL